MKHQIIGIDIGKEHIHVGVCNPAEPDPKKWAVHLIEYEHPEWHHTLVDLIAETAIITAEPTGYHYLAPVAALIDMRRPFARLWQIDHATTGNYRKVHLAGTKSDRLDAIALTMIARDIYTGNPPRHAKEINYSNLVALKRLRLLVNAHQRLSKDRTRTLNRLDQIAFSLWPALAQHKSTWLQFVRLGIVTPREIRAVASSPEFINLWPDGRTRRWLSQLAALLPPDIAGDPTIAQIATQLHADLIRLDSAIETNATDITRQINTPPFDLITKRWRTIPAAFDLAIAALHVPTHGRADQMSADEIKAAVGVNPLRSSSGRTDSARHTKRGYRPARTALYLWTMRMLKTENMPNPVSDHRARVETKRDFWAARSKLAAVLAGVARDRDGYKYFPKGEEHA